METTQTSAQNPMVSHSKMPRRQYWLNVCKKFELSGLTQAEFCRVQMIRLKCLSRWLIIFRREGLTLARKNRTKKVARPNHFVKNKTSFTRVIASHAELPKTFEVELKLSEAISIKLGQLPPPEWLSQVIRGLGA